VNVVLGRHTVEILHNGQAIMGSPFFVEIYDPNKIRIEGTRTGTVNERMEFDSTHVLVFVCYRETLLSGFGSRFSSNILLEMALLSAMNDKPHIPNLTLGLLAVVNSEN